MSSPEFCLVTSLKFISGLPNISLLNIIITAILKVKRRGVIVLKLYQSLTQVQINEQFAGQATGYKLSTTLDKPLNYDPTILYQYLDTVLKPGD